MSAATDEESQAGISSSLVQRWAFAALLTCGLLVLCGAPWFVVVGGFVASLLVLVVLSLDAQASETPATKPPPDVDVDAVASSISTRVGGRRVIIGEGSVCGFDGFVRVGVVTADTADAGELCWQGYLPREQLSVLQEKLSRVATVLRGRLDFYHATKWKRAWAPTPHGFVLVTRRGILARVEDGELVIRRRLRGDLRLDRSQIRSVEARVTESWVRRSIDVVTDSGEVTLLSSRSPWPYLDVCYDGLGLLMDTIWLESLASCLAESLDVPVVLPD